MRACHDDIGHLGLETSLDLLKDKFYWPGMNDELKKHIQNCDRSLHFKSTPQKNSIISHYNHSSIRFNSHGFSYY